MILKISHNTQNQNSQNTHLIQIQDKTPFNTLFQKIQAKKKTAKKKSLKLILKGDVSAALFHNRFYAQNENSRQITNNILKNSVKWNASLTGGVDYKTANGLSFGARLVMRGYTNTKAQFEKHYLFLSTKFGKIILGGQAPVSELFSFNGPRIGASITLDGSVWEYYPFNDDLEATIPSISENANKISYTSPSLNLANNNLSFQLGVSYTPSSNPGPGYPTPQSGGQAIAIRGQNIDKLLSFAAKGRLFFVSVGGGIEVGKNISNVKQISHNIGAEIKLPIMTVGGRLSIFDPNKNIANDKITAYNISGKIHFGKMALSGAYFQSIQNIENNIIASKRRRIGAGVSYTLFKDTEIGASFVRQINKTHDATSDKHHKANIFILDFAARF